jgi:hypothetical protein
MTKLVGTAYLSNLAPHGAVIALHFKKPGHFPMVIEKKAQIQ